MGIDYRLEKINKVLGDYSQSIRYFNELSDLSKTTPAAFDDLVDIFCQKILAGVQPEGAIERMHNGPPQNCNMDD